VIIAWNGPHIQYADKFISETIDLMHGAGNWHFVRSSAATRLKVYHVSQAVDSLQYAKSSFFLDSY